MGHEDNFIFHRIWNELSQINMHKINRVCQWNFQIGLVGSEAVIQDMIEWLSSFPYHDLELPVPSNDTVRSNREIMKRLIVVPVAAGEELVGEKLSTADFCIVETCMVNQVKQLRVDVYPFDRGDKGLAAQILANHEGIRFALSHNFPVFRPEHAKIEIQDTAVQNAAWVFIAAIPTFLPPPHKAIAAPLASFADFIVLTVNEVKLMFELIGLLGEKIQFKHIVEFVFVFGLAKIARGIAGIILTPLPAKTTLLVKGALAYAFTWAIGEAIVFFIVARQKVGWRFLMQRAKCHYRRGMENSKEILKKRVLPNT
ncbi:Hypothetical protein LUCI_2194 [Lucifera butyrica]|uniref:Uncharacterized protein n=1 Tax=Lucifera butyrica TaxID=1351585 RepID=A0A498R9K1_9FIRM|nr:hypothetical protein [Lucifera butyrica]VBB06952.1 Hypothetical protein LUCI_2194 [Lucifera butyrica]